MAHKRVRAQDLKELVEASPFKKDWIADQVGVAPKTFTQILSGQKHPGRAVIKLLAQVLEKPEDAFCDEIAE